MFEFRKILMQVLGDTPAGRTDNSIPLVAIKIFGERQFVHDEIILHQQQYYWGQTITKTSKQLQIMKLGGLLLLAFLATQINAFLCGVCERVAQCSADVLLAIAPESVAIEAVEILCMRKFDSKKLCQKIGRQIAPLAIKNIVKNYVNPHHLCSAACGGIYQKYRPENEAERILAGGKPSQLNLQKYIRREYATIPASKTINVLHISDIHLDQHYTETSSINCDDPICCHKQHGFPENPSAQAGPFGNKKCDCPLKLLDSLLGFLQDKKIDIILATGDYSAHNQWEKTNQSIAQNEKVIQEKIKEVLKPKVLIKSEGNNDFIPDHQYNASERRDLLKVVKVSSGDQILTFISLNTIAYDDMNLYLMGDQSYAIFQLLALEKELNENDNVFILGHEPPTLQGTAGQFQKVYRALVTKYSSKIKGQFFGHLHADLLTVNTNAQTNKITGFGFVCPSVSPFLVGQSRTRIYNFSLQSDKGIGVTDYSQYKMKDILSLNPEWLKQYSFKNKYNLSDDGLPITLEQIQKIKKMIFEEQTARENYILSTGYDPDRNNKAHCHMLDNPEQLRRCLGKGMLRNEDIYLMIDYLRGNWGYDTTLLS